MAKYRYKNFESKGRKFINQRGKEVADTSANICESMLQSKAFKSLTNKQMVLYLYCKAQFYGKRKPKKDYEKQGLFQDDTYFYFNWQLAIDYELYPATSHSKFYKDLKTLEQMGFIEKVKSGKGHKEKNVFKFSDKWQEMG